MFLYLTYPMLRGPVVVRVQEMLTELGFSVGRCGPDGWFGLDTMAAVLDFQTKHGLSQSGVVLDADFRKMEELLSEKSEDGTPGLIVDLRGTHKPPKLFRKERSPIPWKKIIGVTLHQTACLLAENPKRWYTLGAHIGVLRNGTVYIVNDPQDFIWHAQGFSHVTIGIEYNGNFPGVEGDPRTWWKAGGGMCNLTDEQLAASDVLFDWIKAQFDANGQKWKVVYAHRQASKDRRADPGSEIWQKVGSKWIERLGATDGGPDFVYKTGRPIPKEWNKDYYNPY